MDPNAAIRELAEALACQDWQQANILSEALCDWLDHDGFAPNVNRASLRTMLGHLTAYTNEVQEVI